MAGPREERLRNPLQVESVETAPGKTAKMHLADLRGDNKEHILLSVELLSVQRPGVFKVSQVEVVHGTFRQISATYH